MINTFHLGHKNQPVYAVSDTSRCLFSDKYEAQTALSYRAVNTFHLGYKNQSVYAVSGTSRCLFSDKYEAQTALFKDPVRTAL